MVISSRPLLLLALSIAACSGATTSATGGGDGGGSGGTSAGSAGTTTAGEGGTGVGPVCGDGMAEGTEACDGSDLAGSTCADLPGFVGGDLACAADCGSFDTSGCMPDTSGPVVRFNEVTSTKITDGQYAGAGDAIEFYNLGQAAADLSGWKVSDTPGFDPTKTYTFPDGVTLGPGEFLVITKLDSTTGMGDYPFGISSSKPETVSIADAMDTVVDSVSFDGADAAVSWCRLPDGSGDWTMCMRTFGASNAAAMPVMCGNGVAEVGEDCDGSDLGGATCTDLGQGDGTLACASDCTYDTSGCAGTSSAVVLNELTSSNDDNIELYNSGATAFDLSGYILTDGVVMVSGPYDPMTDTKKLVFADGTMIGPGEYMVVIKGTNPGDHPFGLSSSGDTATLLAPDLTIIDHVAYGMDEAAVSYCRLPDGPMGAWQADCTATFGSPNAG